MINRRDIFKYVAAVPVVAITASMVADKATPRVLSPQEADTSKITFVTYDANGDIIDCNKDSMHL